MDEQVEAAARSAMLAWRKFEHSNSAFALSLDAAHDERFPFDQMAALADAVLGAEDHVYGYRIDRPGTMGGREPAIITRVCLTHRDCPREQRLAALDVAFDAGEVWDREDEEEVRRASTAG